MEIRIFSRVDLRRSSGGTEAEEQEVSECLALKSSFSCPHNKHQLALRSPGERGQRGQSLMDLRSPGERGERGQRSPADL
ncbi:Tenascin [Dissostichus eleginoides]|uniref:Tenascin n=1 Tax=Dissostichus eleginoides TaxID=100907 RepID=A0AAD9CJD7_DISEL|nr:Tenascin [Dissostichus eleginoides]